MGIQSDLTFDSDIETKMKLFILAIVLIAGALAEPSADSKPEGKSEADAWLYYNTYGVWPSWYAGYGGYGPGLWGRKKREAEPISSADADAKAYYLLHGVWPAWYSGYYCVNGWQWGYSAC